MAVTWTTACRRLRFLPLQLILVISVVLGLLAVNTIYTRNVARAEWSSLREEELKKYDIREVNMDFVRNVGYVDHRIEDLTDQDINNMNETQLMVAVHSFLDNADTLCRRRIRMGVVGDGGWEVCDDPEVRPSSPPCLVYSFSVRDDSAFEDDIARVYKCEVHSFNIYLEGNDYNRSSNIFVHSYGIGRYSEINPAGKELYTFEDIRTINGHTKRNIDLIKMDVEGAEWPALYGMLKNDELDNVKQLVVECHVGFPPDVDKLRRMIRVLRSMSEAGFRKFYVHKNPRGSFHHPNFPVVRARNYEIHYLNTRFLEKTGRV